LLEPQSKEGGGGKGLIESGGLWLRGFCPAKDALGELTIIGEDTGREESANSRVPHGRKAASCWKKRGRSS